MARYEAEDKLRDLVYKPITEIKQKEQRKKAVLAKLALAVAQDIDLTAMFVKGVSDENVPRVLDKDGNPVIKNGKVVYDKNSPLYTEYIDKINYATKTANVAKGVIKTIDKGVDSYISYNNINVGGGGKNNKKNKDKKHSALYSGEIIVL